MTKRHIVLFLAVVFVRLLSADTNENLIASEKAVGIPKGNFWFAFDFSKEPVNTKSVRVELTGNYCGSTHLGNVLYTVTPNQKNWTTSTKDNKGSWEIKGGSLHQLRLLISQPKFKTADCTINIFASTLLGDPSEAETFLGMIDYQGGFDPNVLLTVFPAMKMKVFRVAIPDYCPGVEVLEASVSSEGILEKAKSLDKSLNLFSVNDGYGMVVGGIFLKVNGPATPCKIPVFMKE